MIFSRISPAGVCSVLTHLHQGGEPYTNYHKRICCTNSTRVKPSQDTSSHAGALLDVPELGKSKVQNIH